MNPPAFYAELACRWYVSFKVAVYAVGKLAGGQFYPSGRLPAQAAAKTVGQLSGFELAWTFFGHSYAYVVFIGGAQLVGAGLLLFARTRLLGVATLVPILLNIIVVDICFGIPRGALLSAAVYLSLLGSIVYFNWVQVVDAGRRLLAPSVSGLPSRRAGVVTVAVVLLGMLLLFFIEYWLMRAADGR